MLCYIKEIFHFYELQSLWTLISTPDSATSICAQLKMQFYKIYNGPCSQKQIN